MTEEISKYLLHNDKLAHGACPLIHAKSLSSPRITPMLIVSAFVTVLGSFSFGFVGGYSAPVQAEIMKELNLSVAEYSLFGSMYTVGAAFGAIICGKITDYLGRNHALILPDVLYICGWFSISVSQSAWMLDLGRWMLGVAMAVSGYALMLTVGSSTTFLIGLITPWRTLALIGIIPSIVQIIGLFFIPESPRWLLMMSRNKKFEEALQRLRGDSADISQEAADIRVGIGLSALTMLVGLGAIICYANSIFESAGLPVMLGTISLAIFQLLSVGLGIILMDSCGRLPLLMISAAGLCLGCLLAGFSFLLEEHQLLGDCSPYIALIGILIYVASYPIGVGGASSIIVSELYPLNIKALAGSIAALIAWLVAWIVTYIFNFAMEWSSSGTFFILAVYAHLHSYL